MEPGTSEVASGGSPSSSHHHHHNPSSSSGTSASAVSSDPSVTHAAATSSSSAAGNSSANSTRVGTSSNSSLKFTGTVSRFCDYFVICGLDYNSGLEVLPSYESDGNCKFENFFLLSLFPLSLFISLFTKALPIQGVRFCRNIQTLMMLCVRTEKLTFLACSFLKHAILPLCWMLLCWLNIFGVSVLQALYRHFILKVS